MISTFAIINIFLQIFITGISLAGVYSFFVMYIEKKKREDYYLTLVFFGLSLYAALTVLSQMAYTLDQSVNIRLILYRVIAIDLVACALFLAFFMKEKFGYRENPIFQAFLLGFEEFFRRFLPVFAGFKFDAVFPLDVLKCFFVFSFFRFDGCC